MSQQTLKESKEDRESCKVELSSLRVPLKSKTLTRINESKHYKNILKTRPHPELQEQRLLLAVSTNNTERVLSLLESGVNPDAADKQLRSALHLATSRGYAEIVRHLLDYGADPNKLDIIRNTPLHLAACLNNFAIIKMLLDAGADVRSLDGYGRDPVQLAQSKLQLLRRSWREGSIEMVNLRSQLQQVCAYYLSCENDSCKKEKSPRLQVALLLIAHFVVEVDEVDTYLAFA